MDQRNRALGDEEELYENTQGVEKMVMTWTWISEYLEKYRFNTPTPWIEHAKGGIHRGVRS